MKILIEMIGHSGLGKTTLALGLASYFKSYKIESVFYQEAIKNKIYFSDDTYIDPKSCRDIDTKSIQAFRGVPGITAIVTDTNGMSGYIFGDLTKEEAQEESTTRRNGFDIVISIYLLPEDNSIKISSIGRYENKLESTILARVEELSKSDSEAMVVKLKGHIKFSDIEEIGYSVLKQINRRNHNGNA